MKRMSLIMALIFGGFLSLPVTAQVGKKGEVKPAPSTTAPKKTTPPKKSPPARRTGRSTTPARTTAPTGNDPAANERIFWESIRNSNNAEDFREYLRQYPSGPFAGLARNRLTILETAAREEAARQEEAKRKAAAAKRPGAVVRNGVGMELVYVPAGSFMMGSENGSSDEKPVHQVTIREGFYMGRYEVTQAQWQQVMENNPSRFKGDNLPVEEVTWDDAQEFIRKLNARGDGYTYRLPSESEWEYACRAGTNGDYAGDLDSMAWYYVNSGDARLSADWNYDKLKANNNRTHPVGSKLPNSFGLFDMHGNVWEWCQDWYHETYFGAPSDGSAWLSGGEQKYRVLRGGSWYDNAAGFRSALRLRAAPGSRRDGFGFRVVAVR